jgi:hypothetical protein
MDSEILNKEKYIETIENNYKVLTQTKNLRGFKIKVTLSGTEQDIEDFKYFVANTISIKH